MLSKIVNAVNADKARELRQLVVYLALTALTVVLVVCDILSDIFLHARSVKVSGGVLPESIWFDWDLSSGVFVGAWVALSVVLWRRR